MADTLYHLSLGVLPRFYLGLSRIWYGSCRERVYGFEGVIPWLDKGPVVACCWHYSVLYMLYHLRHYPSAVMVSASRDGEYVARITEQMGHLPLRGSRNHDGARALKGMLRAMRDGYNCGLIGDGSQGPPRILQPGAILLSSRTRAPIVPISWSASRHLAFSSWDRLSLPLPLARVHVVYGEPYLVPEGLDSQGLEEQRLLVEDLMNRVYHQAWGMVGKEGHHYT
ncbi:lysophospholipid acyltransferase family protein [Desulfolithobacter sp.]